MTPKNMQYFFSVTESWCLSIILSEEARMGHLNISCALTEPIRRFAFSVSSKIKERPQLFSLDLVLTRQ